MKRIKKTIQLLWNENKNSLYGFLAMIGFCCLMTVCFSIIVFPPTYLIAYIFSIPRFPNSFIITIILYFLLFFVYFVYIQIKEAEKSNFKHKHGCVVFKGSKIISTGYNEIRHCWKLDKKYKKWINSLHAEQKTIIFSETSLKRCSLLVIRINNNKGLINSKPCKLCMGLIRDVGISRVYYSDSCGNIREILM